MGTRRRLCFLSPARRGIGGRAQPDTAGRIPGQALHFLSGVIGEPGGGFHPPRRPEGSGGTTGEARGARWHDLVVAAPNRFPTRLQRGGNQAVLQCTTGGVSLHQVVYLYTKRDTVLGAADCIISGCSSLIEAGGLSTWKQGCRRPSPFPAPILTAI
jgi:hypothetical protein